MSTRIPSFLINKRAPVSGGKPFRLDSSYDPSGDQPAAIRELTTGVLAKERDQVLLGVTGSGKTYTMANIIQELQRPALGPGPKQDAGGPALCGDERVFSG